MGACASCCRSSSGEETEKSKGNKFKWEQDLMKNTILASDKVSHAAIVSFSDGELRASGPGSFRPNKGGVKDILRALKGDTSGLQDDGVNIGGGVPNATPGKLDEGKAIYCSNTSGGGVTIFKSKECVLIVAYKSDPASATRLASEVAEHMEENGH